MGIIVFVVVILFMLGVGGMQLYCVEVFGLIKDNKFMFCIIEIVKVFWYIYVFFIIVCGLVYWFCGMSVFDVIVYSFFIVVIGGFLIYNVSIGYYDSVVFEMIIVVFMLLVGVNFGLYFLVW